MANKNRHFYDSWSTVYKYRGFNRDAISLLVDRELYFASPEQLNDPHDCQIDVTAALREALAEFDLSGASPDRKATIAAAADELATDPEIANKLRKMINSQSVCSFSILPDNPLMWTHYADGHRGFCLGFNPRLIRERPNGFHDNVVPSLITYTDLNPFHPVLNNCLNGGYASSDGSGPSVSLLYRMIVSGAVSTKSLAWSYEKECRYLRIQG